MKTNQETIIGKILDLLYPRHCAVCLKVLKDPSRLICPKCQSRLRPLTGHRCLRCGKLADGQAEYCPDCLKFTRYFSEGTGIFHYEDPMKKSILAFKYSGHLEYARFYARAMAVYGGSRLAVWKPDRIVPVPMYPAKERLRGYNQSALIARELSALTHIPCDEKMVVKTAPTRSQKTLNAVQRRNNLYQSLKVLKKADGLTILIVDDVFTTGSTADALARRLKEAGAREVYVCTVCIGRSKGG